MKANKDMHRKGNKESNKTWVGIIILCVGLILLAGQLNMGIIFPKWVLSWPVILILVGVVIGAKSNFKNASSLFLIAFGSIFLLDRHFDINIWKLVIPGFITGLGIWLLLDKNKNQAAPLNLDKEPMFGARPATEEDASYSSNEHDGLDEEYLTSTAIFSEEKKIIISKSLQGGEIVNIFGGTDINLTQADIQGPIVIDVFQLFAGTKIIVPTNWRVHSKVVSIFGEVDDRRFVQDNQQNDSKILYLKGTSIFAGITIKNR